MTESTEDPKSNRPEHPYEQGGALHMSPEKLQALKSKFKLLQQKGDTRSPTILNPPIPTQPILPLKSPSQPATNIQIPKKIEDTDNNKHKLSEMIVPHDSTKIRFTILRNMAQQSQIESSTTDQPQSEGNTSKITKTCLQQIPMVLDVSQHILEQIFEQIRRISPQLDLAHYCHNVLQRLRHEADKAIENGEPVYQSLFELLQHKIYVMVLFKSDEVHWGNLNLKFSDTLLLQKQPCKIFYFLLRMVALLFHAIQHKLAHQEQSSLALEIIKLLNYSAQFLKKGNRICALQQIFQFARHNSLKRDCPCCSSSEDKNASLREDMFAIQEYETSKIEHRNILEQLPVSSGNKEDSIFCGNLAYVSIWQVCQILAMQHKTGCLIIDGKNVTKIYMQDGLVVNCTSNTDKQTEEAFYQMLYEETGRFMFVLDQPKNLVMNQTMECLLMEGSRRMDEARRDQNNPS